VGSGRAAGNPEPVRGTHEMSRFVQKLLKVHRTEASKVFYFALLGALLEVGVALGISTGDTLFLVHVGAARLPVVYILLPFVMLAFTPAFSYLTTRFGSIGTFKITLAVLAVGGIVCSLLVNLSSGETSLPYYFVKLYASTWAISLFTLYWNHVDQYFDMLDAKRLFSVFAGGSACGAAVGGGIVTLLARVVRVENLFLVWALVAAATLPVIVVINRRWRTIEPDTEPEKTGFVRQTLEVTRIMNRSRYVVLLNLVLVATVFLSTVCEYQYLGIFSESTGKEELAVLFGTLFALTNVFNLFVNFFVFSRAVLWIGVRNMALIQPLTYLVTFGLLGWSAGWSAAVVGFFAFQGIQSSIDNNNWNFVMNGVPGEVKSQVRTFSEGISEPLAASFAGLFLLLGAPLMTSGEISAVGVGGSVVLIGAALLLRMDYLPSIMRNLRRDWLDFSRSNKELLADLDPGEIAELEKRSLANDQEVARNAIRLLIDSDRRLALESLLRTLEGNRAIDPGELRSLLSDILEDADVEILTALVRAMGLGEIAAEAAVVEVLGSQGLIQSEALASLQNSADPSDRAAAAVAQWNSWNLTKGVQAISTIDQLLRGGQAERWAGIRALGQMRQSRYAHFLSEFLRDPDRTTRCEALAAIRNLARRDSGHLVPELIRAFRDGGRQERELVIDVLSRIRDSRCIQPLLSSEQGLSPQERRKIEKLILETGLGSVPIIVAVLRDPNYDYQSRSIAARTLANLAFPQFASLLPELIRTELDRAYGYLHLNRHLGVPKDASCGFGVLTLFYRDIQQTIVEFVLEALAMGGRLPDFEMISASLRSTNPKVRANAVESIEQACSREIFKRLFPLLDRSSLEEQGSAGSGRHGSNGLDREQIVERALESAFDLERSSAAQALWEHDPEGSVNRLRARLPRVKSRLFGEIILSLLEKPENPDGLNEIEKIYRLSQAEFFDSFGVRELSIFSQYSRVMRLFDGDLIYRSGDQANETFVIFRGQVRVENGCSRQCGIGHTFGAESLFGEGPRRETVFSEGVSALVVDAAAFREEAARHPKVALGLLGARLGIA